MGGRVAAEVAAQALDLCHAGSHVVVHGAGPQISAEMKRLGIPVEFVDGRRVTDPAALAVVRVSLVAVGAEVSAALGPAALPRVEDEIGLQARPSRSLGCGSGRPAARRASSLRIDAEDVEEALATLASALEATSAIPVTS